MGDRDVSNNVTAEEGVKVSVVMAVHRGVDYEHLRKAINSITHQTLKEFELVVICDGPLTSAQELFISDLAAHHTSIPLESGR